MTNCGVDIRDSMSQKLIGKWGTERLKTIPCLHAECDETKKIYKEKYRFNNLNKLIT